MTLTPAPHQTPPASYAARMIELSEALRAIAKLNNLIGPRSVLMRAAAEFDRLADGPIEAKE